MSETTFFEHEDVKVTNARFIVEGQTYAMNNVTSVTPMKQDPKRFWPLLTIISAVVLLLNEQYVWALVVGVLGGLWLAKQKPLYHVMLRTSGGETSALKTHQKDYMDKVIAALNSAIVARG